MKFKVGDIVVSKVNTTYNLSYKIIKCNKTTCWTKTNDKDSFIHKNVKYSVLEHKKIK